MPVSLEPGDLFRPRPGAVVAKNPLGFVDDDDRAVGQFVPQLGRVELDPTGLEPVSLEIRNAVVVDRSRRRVRLVAVPVQAPGRVVRVGLMLDVDFADSVERFTCPRQASA
ncbi:hypothetical protein D3C84_655180 [compost metagenome]